MTHSLRHAELIDTFLESPSAHYNYSDLHAYAHQFQRHLSESEPVDKIAFIAGTTDELVLSIASCWILGIPFIPLSGRMTDNELRFYLDQLHPRLILSDPCDETLRGVTDIPVSHFPVFDKELPYPGDIEPNSAISNDDVFGYFFTSGTTSRPKIVPLKRRQMIHAAESGARNFKPAKNGLWLLCLPLNHIGGVSVIIRSLLYGTGVYRLDRFDAERTAGLLKQKQNIEAASLVPTMLTRLLDYPGFELHPGFKAILLGGGPVPATLRDRIKSRDLPVVYSYGMTETCAQIAAVPLAERSGAPENTAGRVFRGNQIQIRDEQENTLDSGQTGMIWLKGPQVFDGYLDEPAESVFDKENWFRTGDIGRMDSSGNIFIISRRDDLIITGGENVSPFEIEDALTSLPFVDEAAVVGEPDPEWGQSVTAVVILKPGTKPPALEDIRNALSEILARYKLPKKVIFTDCLPRTRSGKIIRQKLLEIVRKN